MNAPQIEPTNRSRTIDLQARSVSTATNPISHVRVGLRKPSGATRSLNLDQPLVMNLDLIDDQTSFSNETHRLLSELLVIKAANLAGEMNRLIRFIDVQET